MINAIDVPWVLNELRGFIAMTTLIQGQSPPGITFFGDPRRTTGNHTDIFAAAQVVEQILDRVLPDWRLEAAETTKREGHTWEGHREAAVRAVAQLERQEEIAERLGDNAPRLSAASMHSSVWAAAKSLWQSGHFREAVRAASVQVNADAQNKVGRRDVSERDLFNKAFNDDAPTSDANRLRLPSDDGGRTADSERRGVRFFAMGCYSALRNPSSHELLAELPENEALEQLAAFSILARWIEEAEVVSV